MARLYLLPLAFAVLLAVVGRWAYVAVERASADQVRAKLETIVASSVAAIDLWTRDQRAIAEDLAADPRLEEPVLALRDRWRESDGGRAALQDAPEQARIEAALGDAIARHRFLAWRIWSPGLICLASSEREAIGRPSALDPALIHRAMDGEELITPPLEFEASGQAPLGVMAMLTPIHDATGEVISVLGIGIDAATSFAALLAVASPGETGETYAFSPDGRLLSRSRFEEQLREIGLLPADPSVSSFRRISIRDPGGDLTSGFDEAPPVLARPLTQMAASALEGLSGANVEGYRDYRGVLVAGAWAWLPELQLGLATEIDVEEAYGGLAELRLRFISMSGLLVLAAAGLFGYSALIGRMRGSVERARQLGRYRIERVIGRGGMGTVYLASHALLRRPTAIKLLRKEHSSSEAVARFEREVQVTASLTHPNTIAIYDYGRTFDGTFYYAMEYVEGVTLRACVDEEGPMPPARAVHVLLQICGSIGEAHAQGLIHRDLKPSNVMLCERGRVLDFVKVLDFGLVRPQTQTPDLALTSTSSLTGTPLYMPPEAIEAPDTLDARGDIYQIGAIGYFLLSGHHVFRGDNLVEVLDQHLHAEPKPLGADIPDVLRGWILRCLAKAPGDRPDSVDELAAALETLAAETPWSRDRAAAWWRDWWSAHPAADAAGGDAGSLPSGAEVDIGHRMGHAPRA
jgi:hypothetical protein